MPEWLVEHGIGETRAALVDDGEIIESRISLEGTVPAGSVLTVRLLSGGIAGRNAVALSEGGTEYLLPRGASGVADGAMIEIEVTREAIPGSEAWKRPLARLTDKKPRLDRPFEELTARPLDMPAMRNELGESGWDDLIEEARSGITRFAGGELRIAATPAMTLIDVDGYLSPQELARIGAREAARAIRRLDIAGSIGVDLPTLNNKSARQAAAEAIDAVLPLPFERTAVNGFGFLQIVRPRRRASLVELAQDRPMFEARALLRRAGLEIAGAKMLVAHPAVIQALEQRSPWVERLSRQLGGVVRLRADPSLPMSGGYARPD